MVIDTTSIYAEMVINQLSNYGEKPMTPKKGSGQPSLWQAYNHHFIELRDRLHALPLHVVWTFHADQVTLLEKVVSLDYSMAGPKTKRGILASCAFCCYLEAASIMVQEDPTQPAKSTTQRRLWVRCPSTAQPQYVAGSRYCGLLKYDAYQPDFNVLRGHLNADGQKRIL